MIWENLATIGTLVVLEGLLSADNALVLAILVRHLPEDQRKRALRYGIIGAFVFRFLCILIAAWLIHAWFFKILGAAYLLGISLKHLLTKDIHKEQSQTVKKMSFWQTIVIVELTDIVFSIDSILAAVAISSKLWVVYTGGVLGVITMRFVAGSFLTLLDRFPGLEKGAYLLVGWIGLKLALMTAQEEIAGFPHIMSAPLFWSVMAIIFFGSMFWKGKPHKHRLPEELK
ncbi:MAG: TerC family protein [Deltaproteobacteria bacterium]|nr:TerC family protein [Deltaproteobacteria bacterium]